MPRAQKGAARHQAKKRWFDKAKGNRNARRNLWRTVKPQVIRSGVYKYEHRRQVKRDYRKLWIVRINAACRERGMSYSRFMAGLKMSGIALNRKMLSEVAIHDAETFDKLVELARSAPSESEALAAA